MNKKLKIVLCWLIAGVFSFTVWSAFSLIDGYILKESLRSTTSNLFTAGAAFGYSLNSLLHIDEKH